MDREPEECTACSVDTVSVESGLRYGRVTIGVTMDFKEDDLSCESVRHREGAAALARGGRAPRAATPPPVTIIA